MLFLILLTTVIQTGSTASHPLVPSISTQNFECSNSNMMKCAGSSVCLPLYLICNGHDDCEDESDETNCDIDDEEREMQSNRVLCSLDEYRCQDETGKCIPTELACDGTIHCSKGDDEDPEKCKNCREKNCEHKCHIGDSENGCYCPDGAELKQDDRTCSPVDHCKTQAARRCQQYCKTIENGYKCSCDENYTLDEDGHACHIKGGIDDGSIFITIGGRQIVTIPLNNSLEPDYMEQQHVDDDETWPNKKGYSRVIDYNNHDDTMYLGAREQAQHASLFTITGTEEKILRRDLAGPVTIAVDYVGGNIFYTHTYHKNPGIYVCTADALFCRRVVAGQDAVQYRDHQHFKEKVADRMINMTSKMFQDKLRAAGLLRQFYGGIALNPFTGKMVWIDIYRPQYTKLMMGNMDGTEVEELYDNGNHLIHGVTIDPIKDDVYFANWAGSFSIMRINLKTREGHVVVSEGAGQAYDLRYFNGILYWTGWNDKWTRKTLRMARIRSDNCTGQILQRFNEWPCAMAIKHPKYQPMPPVNPCAKLSCPWICVIIPASTPGKTLGKCLCPENYNQEEGICVPSKNIAAKEKHEHLLEADSYVDLNYWKDLCSRGTACLNGGQCAKLANDIIKETYCNCPEPFIGERCEVADTRSKQSSWTIFRIMFLVSFLATMSYILFHKKDKISEYIRAKRARFTRPMEFPQVRFSSEDATPGSRDEPQPFVSFSSPLYRF